MNVTDNNGRLQIKKVIYNKAFKAFIQDKHGSGVHFGNMNNNLNEILVKLSLDKLMVGTVKLPSIDINTLSVINNHINEFSDFDVYDNFICIFSAKPNVSSEDFMNGIAKLKTEFLETYNKTVHQEITEKEHQDRLLTKKKEIKEIIFYIAIAIVAMLLVYFFSNKF